METGLPAGEHDVPGLQGALRLAEARAGMPIVIRGIRVPDPGFRGRVTKKACFLLLEYQVSQPGYFWHIPVIEELLRRIQAGQTETQIQEA